MNDYTGKICPYCKTEFHPNDDIVVCSECDMPHHKDCWIENQGCTTFGCLGTIKTDDSGASSVTATQIHYDDAPSTANSTAVFCAHCGTQNPVTSSFCFRCGNRLTSAPEQAVHAPVYTQANPANSNPYAYVNQYSTPYQPQSSYQSNGYTTNSSNIDADMQQLVGTKTEYYIPKFQVMKSQGTQTSWNWPAFLVTPYWMIYRKMYGYGAAVLGVAFIISLIGSGFLSLLAFGGYIVMGIFANSIYMKHLESKAAQAKSMSEPYRSQFIAKNSGVNTAATVLTLIGYALLIGILSA